MSAVSAPWLAPAKVASEALDFNRAMAKGFGKLSEIREIDVEPTEKEAVYREDEVILYHYRPRVQNPHPVPVLIVYALVNRPYMTDLQKGRSLVANLLDRGLDVYLIDWGYPDAFERYLTLDDYIDGYLDDCVETVLARHSLTELNLLGICQGGTFSLCYAALNPEKVKNLVTMVTPVDFHVKDGLLNVWSRALDADAMVEAYGNVPGNLMNWGFLMLKPWQLLVQKYANLDKIADDEEELKSFLRMEKWIFDSPDQAGEAFRQFVREFYQGNKLVKGEIEIGGRRVDLKAVTMPVCNVYAEADHLVPPSSSLPLKDYVGAKDVTTVAFPGGHIGLYVSSKSQKELAPALARWIKERP